MSGPEPGRLRAGPVEVLGIKPLGVSLITEITAPVDLCDPRGHLNLSGVGWSRRPLHRCNLRGQHFRKKRWDYWCITTPRHLFSATLSNLDYLGLAFVYYLDLKTARFTEQTVMMPLGRGCALGEVVGAPVDFRHPRLELSIAPTDLAMPPTGRSEPGSTGTRVRVLSPDFGGQRLEADFLVETPAAHETLNVVIPWSERRFQFTSKQNCLPTRGTVRLDGTEVEFPAGEAFACLDYGRGVWPYASFWNWAAGSGRTGGRTVGLNLGAGWTDGSGQTENGLCVDGRLTKLEEDLEFAYDPKDFRRPWAIRTRGSDRVRLEFTPLYERVAKTDLWLLRSEVHQLIGRFSGVVVTGEGDRVRVSDLPGWAEEHNARW